MKLRIISALIIVPPFLVAIIKLPLLYFALLLAVVFAVAIFESMRIFLPLEGIFEKVTFVIMVVLVAAWTFTGILPDLMYFSIFLYFLVFLFRNLALNRQGSTIGRKTIQRNFRNLTSVLFFSVYLGVPFALMLKLRILERGPLWFALILIVCWGGDSGAYFAGKYLRKRFPYRLFPVVSPNKTWVGALGSGTSVIILVFLFDSLFVLNLSLSALLIIGIAGSIISQAGDLFESFIKRNYRVKDSGNFIPGHGGILDKFDGIIFCTPFFFLFVSRFYCG